MKTAWKRWNRTVASFGTLLAATLGVACASRALPSSFAGEAAASPAAPEAPAARVGVALAEDPPLPGEAAASWSGLVEDQAAPHQHQHGDAKGEIAVRADEKGFTPSHVSVEKGKPLTLIFTRTSDETCARDIVFPDLGIKKPLPKDTPVRVDLPTNENRTFTFQCGMGMYKSQVVVQ